MNITTCCCLYAKCSANDQCQHKFGFYFLKKNEKEKMPKMKQNIATNYSHKLFMLIQESTTVNIIKKNSHIKFHSSVAGKTFHRLGRKSPNFVTNSRSQKKRNDLKRSKTGII